MNVMKKAWEIAKSAAFNNEGTAREYFAESLKLAWEMKNSFEITDVNSRYWNKYDKERQYITFSVRHKEVKAVAQGIVIQDYCRTIEFYYDYKNESVKETREFKISSRDKEFSSSIVAQVEEAKRKEIDIAIQLNNAKK
ncbi:TPA_asm: hypothetical protein GHP91_04515 [Listeria monocytogenes]|nr:hypothetical protein [Listeria monocytogenes]